MCYDERVGIICSIHVARSVVRAGVLLLLRYRFEFRHSQRYDYTKRQPDGHEQGNDAMAAAEAFRRDYSQRFLLNPEHYLRVHRTGYCSTDFTSLRITR